MFAPWGNSYDKLIECIKRQRHPFADKGSYCKIGLSSSHVWIWESDHKEGWAPKNWGFKLWCWKRLLRVPWTVKRSNHSVLKEITHEYSLEGLMLKFQYFGHLRQRTDSLEKTLMLGKIEGGWRRWWKMMRLLDGIADSMDMSLRKFQEIVKVREAWHAASHGITNNWTWFSNWTTININ